MPCVICLESKRWWHNTTSLMCGHKFHTHCITPWVLVHYMCPLCKGACCKEGEKYLKNNSLN